MNAEAKIIPGPVVRRLTKYLVHLQGLRDQGVEWVSSRELAQALGLTSSTVRQDLSHLDFSGVSKRGYEIEGLEKILVRLLRADSKVNVVIVGAGNLGRALALHAEFPRRGFTICAIFDSDSRLLSKKIGAIEIKGMDELPKVVCERKVEIGLITVPASSAQEVADRLVAAGVRGILNFASAHIMVPKRITVVEARIIASLRELGYLIKGMEKPGGQIRKNRA